MSELQTFYADVAAHDLQPLWTQTRNLMPDEPKPAAKPWLWRWQDVRPLCERAGRLVPIERGGERRVLSLSNPGLGGLPFATPTLWAAFQFLGPHESAPAHRHSPGAIRFVVEGEGAWTTVDGDACDMTPGDLVLTPSWCWHDHKNASDRPMIWFDGLDMPTVIALDGVFFEPHPDASQPIAGRNVSEKKFANGAGSRNGGHDKPHSPLLVYRWRDTDAALGAKLSACGDPEVTIRYVSPLDGSPVLPTLGCAMTRLRVGRATPPIRRAGSSVHVVFRGRGASVIDGRRFAWQAGDSFVVPSWAAVEHAASEPADLFSIDDRPIFDKLGLYREVSLDRPQAVVGEFEPR